MADDCPDRSVLESYAHGQLPDESHGKVETHLNDCLICAEAIEQLTRAELNLLVCPAQSPDPATMPPHRSPVLDRVMRVATETPATCATPTESPWEDLRRILDPPVKQGDLGSFAGYDILEIAGRGGMGVVFKAWDRTLQRIVALMVILPRRSSDLTIAARWLEEARTVAALQHDHIVAVHHAGMAKGLPFLLMPFHAEGTLERCLKARKILPPPDVVQVGLQLARALAATHARGILHRDIKPSNVLLERASNACASRILAWPARRETMAPPRRYDPLTYVRRCRDCPSHAEGGGHFVFHESRNGTQDVTWRLQAASRRL
jgi:Protein kinase domain